MSRQRWSPDEWFGALAQGEATRMAKRFAKEAETASARRPPRETEDALKQRLVSEFSRATEQRAAQERTRQLAAVKALHPVEPIVPAKSISRGVNGHGPGAQLAKMAVQGVA
jgi:hypothetical protein